MRFLLLLSILGLAACGRQAPTETAPAAQEQTIVVYSSRNEQLVAPLIERYEAAHPHRITLVTAKAGPLLERMRAEGAQSPADVLLTVDAGNLWQAAEWGLLRPLDSATLTAAVPPHLRDSEGRWFGLSVRARTIVHHVDRAPASELRGYRALTEPQWKGRLCLRTSKKVYNQSLVAMLIEEYGESAAEATVRGWVANLAAPPFSNDTAVMEAILAGQCDVGIVNTYYYGRLQRETPDLPLALFWPDQDSTGVHVNISGAGVTASSDVAAVAQGFLEWLATGEAQAVLAASNLEYPANPQVPAAAEVSAWGSFKQNLINVAAAGQRQAQAVKLMDRAGYR